MKWTRRWCATAAVGALLLAGCTSSSPDEVPDLGEVTTTVAPGVIEPSEIGLASGTDAEAATTQIDRALLSGVPELDSRLGEVAAPEATFDVVSADRQVLGVRSHSPAGTDAVVYGDVANGRAWTSADLLTAEGRTAVTDAVLELEPDTAVDLFKDVRFNPDGSLLVVDPSSEAGRAWRIARDAIDPFLTADGRLVRAAARTGGGFVGVPPIPAAEGEGETPDGTGGVVAAVLPLPPPPAPAPPPPPPDGAPVVDCATAKCVALTFDDGPGPDTGRLLDMLAARNVPATFFFVGKQVNRYPDTVRAILDAGHELGDHTWNHPDLRTLTPEGVRDEIKRTSQAIKDASGQGPTVMRPPYGAVNDEVLAELKSLGLPVILWNVDTEDWKTKDATKTKDAALAGAKPGSIILMHDIHASTVDAVPAILDGLAAQGYTFVTVSQLYGGSLNPGEKYFSRPPA